MAGHAAAPLQGCTNHRITGIRGDIERRTIFLRLFFRQPFIIDAVEAVGMDMALETLHVMHRMRQHHYAALREHDIIIEILAQLLPELHRMFIKMRALVIKIVGANNGRVAPGIATAEPSLFDNRDIGDAVFLGQIIGSAKAMPARTDDDDIIFGPGLGIGPLRLPVSVAGKRIFND